jgi:hypothetical protein
MYDPTQCGRAPLSGSKPLRCNHPIHYNFQKDVNQSAALIIQFMIRFPIFEHVTVSIGRPDVGFREKSEVRYSRCQQFYNSCCLAPVLIYIAQRSLSTKE